MSLLPLMKYTHEIIDLLWAQLVLSHSILVYGSSVSIVTQCVLSLASLICPLEPQLDIRPTLTIYDSDLSAFPILHLLSSSSQAPQIHRS